MASSETPAVPAPQSGPSPLPPTHDTLDSARWFSPRLHAWITALLLILGVQCWLILGHGDYGLRFQRRLLLAALVLSLIPPVNRRIWAMLQRIRRPSRRLSCMLAAGIAILATCYFPFTGWYQSRNFEPKWQDEFSYLIQIQMLARGRLWMPQHPLADFFDTFQVLVRPVYASIYFPGAALLYTPMKWLHVPYWLASAAAAGVTVALLYLIVSELLDQLAGVLAALMLVGVSMFRKLALMIGGHPPLMLLALAMLWCWLRWRSTRQAGWAIAAGAFAGWAAITRPLDALVLAAPVAIDVLLWLAGQPLRRWLGTIAAFSLPAMPFIAIQIIFNIGVTGSPTRTPFELYADRDYPGTKLGFHHYDPARRPVSQLPQKQRFHDEWTVPAIREHQPALVVRRWFDDRFGQTLWYLLPHRMLLVLLPVGLIGLLSDRRHLLLWLTLPLYVILYSLYTFALPHYAIIAAPAVILMVLLGARQVERLRRAGAGQRALATFVYLFIAILSITELAEFNRFVRDEIFDPPGLRRVNEALRTIEHKPAVVLFRFPADGNPHEEPVYNFDVAWPDEAQIIRAHDLGPQRNREIFSYYAQRQPDRAFYLYDRADDSIRFLGFASELARRVESGI